MIDLLFIFVALVVIMFPFLAWGKLFAYSLDNNSPGVITVLAALFIGIPMYLAVVAKILEVVMNGQ